MKGLKLAVRGIFLGVVLLSLSNAFGFYNENQTTPSEDDFAQQFYEGTYSGSTVGAASAGQPSYVPDRLIIKYKKNSGTETSLRTLSDKNKLNAANADNILSQYNLKVKKIEKLLKTKPAVKTEVLKKLQTLLAKKGPMSLADKFREKKLRRMANEGELREKYGLDRIFVLDIDKTNRDMVSLAKQISQNPDVEYAEPDYIFHTQMAPNDPYFWTSGSWGQSYDDLWGLKLIDCQDAWDITQGEDVVVAVIDSGVDYNHPDLAGNIWTNEEEVNGTIGVDDDDPLNDYIDDVRGWNCYGNDNEVMDNFGHGTHCAGIIAAVGNNNIGIIGVAPQAKIMAVKVGEGDQLNASVLANGVEYAVDNGADILSCSWGGPNTQALSNAFSIAHEQDCVCIASAGNASRNTPSYPATISTVIAVAASNQNDGRCNFSNYGYKIDVSAPGGDSDDELGYPYIHDNILSLRANGTDMYSVFEGYAGIFIVDNDYYRARGTSMACPYVAGLAALLKSANPNYSGDDIRTCILLGADNIDQNNPGFEGLIGAGRINTYNSLVATPATFIKLVGVSKDILPPGQTGTLKITLENFGLEATGVSGTLSTTNPHITIQNGTYVFGDMGQTIQRNNNNNPFAFVLDNQIPYDQKLSFNLFVQSQNGYTKNIPIVVSLPINGQVTLQDYSGNKTILPITVKMIQSVNHTYVVDTYTLHLDSNGRFFLPRRWNGNWDIMVKASHWLSRTEINVPLSDGYVLPTFDLPNGDANGDDALDSYDIDSLYAAINGNSANAQYDLNGDGSVNQTDVDFLIHDLLHTEYGDADLSLFVDEDDYNWWNYGYENGFLEGYSHWNLGDFDGNGVVDEDDYVLYWDGYQICHP